jgi:alpha-L-rhamnosidase
LAWNVTIPPNTTARLILPAAADAVVTESGRPLRQALGVGIDRALGNNRVVEVESGSYRFAVDRLARR